MKTKLYIHVCTLIALSLLPVLAQAQAIESANIAVTRSASLTEGTYSILIPASGEPTISIRCGTALEDFSVAFTSYTVVVQCTGDGIGFDYTGEGEPEFKVTKVPRTL